MENNSRRNIEYLYERLKAIKYLNIRFEAIKFVLEDQLNVLDKKSPYEMTSGNEDVLLNFEFLYDDYVNDKYLAEDYYQKEKEYNAARLKKILIEAYPLCNKLKVIFARALEENNKLLSLQVED